MAIKNNMRVSGRKTPSKENIRRTNRKKQERLRKQAKRAPSQAKKKVVCLMAAHERVGITVQTIRYLIEQSYPIREFVIVGDSYTEEDICELSSKFLGDNQKIHYVQAKNRPLGKKWQTGLNVVSTLDGVDNVLICGSDNWLGKNWLRDLMPYTDKYDVVGRNRFFVCDLLPKDYSIDRVLGRQYRKERGQTPIGSGRIYSKRFLDIAGWNLYPLSKNRGLDGACQRIIEKHKVPIMIDNKIGDSVVLAIKGPWEVISGFDKFTRKSKHEKFDVGNASRWLSSKFAEAHARLAEACRIDRERSAPICHNLQNTKIKKTFTRNSVEKE